MTQTPNRAGAHLAAAALIAAILAGCGSQATESAKRFQGEQRDVAQVVEDFQQASRDGDAKKVCDDLFSPRTKPQDCEKEVKTGLDQLGSKKVSLDVRSVAIKGDTATARVAVKEGTSGDSTATYPLAKEDGGWRITSDER